MDIERGHVNSTCGCKADFKTKAQKIVEVVILLFVGVIIHILIENMTE